MQTQKGTLAIGIEKDGVCHKDFELRLPTLLDVELAMEQAGENASMAKVNRFKWARCLVKFGTLPEKDITAQLLSTLPSLEYGILKDAEESLEKKCMLGSATP